MIYGVGIDVVDIDRIKQTLERTLSLKQKFFTETERSKSIQSLAARFAAKEAHCFFSVRDPFNLVFIQDKF